MSSVVTENLDSQNGDSVMPNPGDLIEISIPAHTHWAVYVGDGYVVHLTHNVGTGLPGKNVIHLAFLKNPRGVVRKELLSTVARGYRYKVNNKYDEKKLPLCAEKIVQRAEAQVRKKMRYHSKNYNCEHFATELRYEVPLSDQNGDGPQPREGDLIEFYFLAHAHWAVYVGDGYVVHLTKVGNGSPGKNVAHFVLGTDTRGVVRKELLTSVARGYRYKVNNKHDEKKLPLCAEKIVQRAEAQVGKEMTYNFKSYTCEHFATELRYEVPLSDQRRIGPWPKPGDLIEIFRKNYQHWAVFVGDGYVVHLTRVEHGVSGIYVAASGFGLSTTAMVKKEPLTNATAGCKYKVNNKYDKKMQPLPEETIVREAEGLAGMLMDYNLITHNCEHFATKLRYGEPMCDQVWKKIAQLALIGAIVVLI